MYIKNLTILLFIFSISIILTWLARIYSIRNSIIDIPNERSSHIIPTPRGGGIAIVLSFTIALLYLFFTNQIDTNLILALGGGGIAIAIIGYCDDIFSVNARWRLILHFLVAGWALYWLHGLSVLNLGILKISTPGVSTFLALVGIVWCINFYNFMDGIDGLAGSQGIFVSIASCAGLWWLGASHLALLMGLLIGSIAGFTIWNWPPAKIFLGDVGSGFLGYIFAVFALYCINKEYLSLSFWMIILAVFLWDATFTLIYRAYHGRPLHKAHREHAYQHLIAYGASHKQVTLSIIFFNGCILLPVALLQILYPAYTLFIMFSLLLTLWLGWYWIKSLPLSNRNELTH